MGVLFGSFTYDLLLLACSLCIYLYLKLRSRMRYFEGSGIPYIPFNSLLENNTIGAFSKESVGEIYDKMYKRLAGHKYGGFFNTLVPSILVRDTELIKTMLTTDFQYFNDHGIPTDEETNLMEGNLFFLSGLKWKALRRKLSPAFTSGKLKWMYGLMVECGDQLVDRMSSENHNDQEMKDLVARFTSDVVGTCAFGLEPESIKNPESEFRRMGKKFFNPDIFKMLKSSIRFMCPSFFKKFKIRDQPRSLTDFFQNMTSQTLEYRIKSGEQRNDFVQLLLQLKMKGFVETDPQDLRELEYEENEDKDIVIEFTDTMLAAQASVFFVAGFETTASAISFTLYLLAKRQDVQEKARREVKEMKEKYGGSITYQVVKSIPYVEACLSECMRLYPPVHLLPRQCTKDYTMEDGYTVKKGTPVIIPIFSIHRDPDYYPDPDVYRPERFLGEEGNSRPPATYLPFGYGPRLCLARRFAILESVMVLAKILDNFVFKLSPKMGDHLKLVSKTFIVVPQGGLWLNFNKID